jgi:hypothetical protein
MLLGIALGGLLIVAALGLAGAIAFGGPTPPPPLLSIRDAVLKRDRTDLPNPAFFLARDQTTLAYRSYPAAAGPAIGAAVLIHGSVGSGADMHEIAKALTMASTLMRQTCAATVRLAPAATSPTSVSSKMI